MNILHSIHFFITNHNSICMHKLSLVLLSGSALSAAALSNLFLDQPAHAINVSNNDLPQSLASRSPSLFDCNQSDCTGNDRLAIFERLTVAKKGAVSKPQNLPELNFTDEESDAAIAKFGCDCPRSINVLRQTRGITVGVEGEYLPPTQKPKPCKDGNNLDGDRRPK
jgi:hypothetical protein